MAMCQEGLFLGLYVAADRYSALLGPETSPAALFGQDKLATCRDTQAILLTAMFEDGFPFPGKQLADLDAPGGCDATGRPFGFTGLVALGHWCLSPVLFPSGGTQDAKPDLLSTAYVYK